ncbi:hypothetical protein [Spiroplasma taiwanense]|uniref:Uncharacterized protein n=1 Tax=Spiroplasma taiwanense CT-1 TaxID=1276220 RepID=S5M0T5_9MOLU|nr:hypothetical protein [Spiroplasma taiwanense]AGR41617.1 hypothetical protein STAIW_v1c10340 [Spiroplasma taiwanense CT-1]
MKSIISFKNVHYFLCILFSFSFFESLIINYNFLIFSILLKIFISLFGDFYRFNFSSKYFKNSLIGQIYLKNNYFLEKNLTNSQIDSAIDIFNFMFYLNNSALTYSIKQDLIEEYNKNEDGKNIEDFLNLSTSNESIGRVGKFDQDNKYYFSKNIYSLFKSNKSQIVEKNLYENYASFNIKKHDSRDIFKTGIDLNGYIILENSLTQRSWFDSYFNLLGDLSNFKVKTTNETVMWTQNGNKFRYISAFYNQKEPGNENYSVHFYNENLYTIYLKNESDNIFTENSFMDSNGYAKFNNLVLGQEYELFPNTTKKYRLDATGVDSLNVYPTIYEEDLLINQENEAVFYISNTLFQKFLILN